MQCFRGGLVFKAHIPLNHSTLDLRVIKKRKKGTGATASRTDSKVGSGKEKVR